METFEEFKRNIEKFIYFLNERMKLYHLETDEEYDEVIDSVIIEYYRNGNRDLVFYDMEYFEENLERYDGKNPYSITHCCTDEWGRPRGKNCPREHTCSVESVDGMYEADITTIAIMFRPYLYKKLLTDNNIFIPQFFLETISKCGRLGYLYEIKNVYEYDPFK